MEKNNDKKLIPTTPLIDKAKALIPFYALFYATKNKAYRGDDYKCISERSGIKIEFWEPHCKDIEEAIKIFKELLVLFPDHFAVSFSFDNDGHEWQYTLRFEFDIDTEKDGDGRE